MADGEMELLAREFERRAAEAEARTSGSFMVSSQGYRDQRSAEARVWREAAKVARERVVM